MSKEIASHLVLVIVEAMIGETGAADKICLEVNLEEILTSDNSDQIQ
jgi:hypothetical protein